MLILKSPVAWIFSVVLSFSQLSIAQTIIASSDFNMISGLDPSLTTQSVTELAVRPSGVEQFLENILEGGSQVFVDQYTSHSNRGIIGAYEQLFNFYNLLPGVTAVMPGGDFSSSALADVDVLISVMPNTAYTPAELQAMSDLLGNGGTIFFLGDAVSFSVNNGLINDALTFLGSGLVIIDSSIATPGWPFYTSSVDDTHPLMSGVPNLSVAVSGSMSGGNSLAFYIHDGVQYAILAIDDGSGSPAINAGHNDAWYNPNTDGQGFFISVFPDLGFVSLAWFTYDTELPGVGDTANLGDPGHRWLTALGAIEGSKSVMDINFASGGIFDTATDIDRTEDGTITLTIANCVSGTIEYDIPSIGRKGIIPIQRVAADNTALCLALSAE